jgi:hypothetical protein
VGIFDESEGRRTKRSQAQSHLRPARSSWPLSARLLVGALLILNIPLVIFFLSKQFRKPEARTISPSLRPGAGSSPQRSAPAYPGSGLDQGSSPVIKVPPVETRPAAVPARRAAKRPPIHAAAKALRMGKSAHPVLSAATPHAVIYPPHEPVVQPSAPVRSPAVPLSATANVPSPVRAPSSGVPAASVPSSANAPAGSALPPRAIDRALPAKQVRSASVANVASVKLPAMAKGSVMPKGSVASVASQIKVEMIPRPAVSPENCGDDKAFVACPTLKTRYDTPFTSQAPEAP